jgi:hypothetical protein
MVSTMDRVHTLQKQAAKCLKVNYLFNLFNLLLKKYIHIKLKVLGCKTKEMVAA